MGHPKIPSSDTHVIEPPDLYITHIDPKLRNHDPRMARRKTPEGQEYDEWFMNGVSAGSVGNYAHAVLIEKDPSRLKFHGLLENVRKSGYDPHEMI